MSYTLTVTVASINTNVVVRLDGSIDGTNYAPIIAAQTITNNGTTVYSVADRPVKFIKGVFVIYKKKTNISVALKEPAKKILKLWKSFVDKK